ncbi:hypothetical protein K3718_09955 [Leisingera aquaemixtae]|uniref:Uncharacterized protein n=1 Tax=Leisingera aquaemixtae TaxID=1396826 RepID=A0ABY5WEM2_9RHOB|nr:hypothetical protein [Leisingera aquaemixtae]UWQ39914.1 hypothetical protein K3718_09955 [Leisingera aquaemixtae]
MKTRTRDDAGSSNQTRFVTEKMKTHFPVSLRDEPGFLIETPICQTIRQIGFDKFPYSKGNP